jgi:carbon-monoxide dehydrogenase large subunit
VVNAVLDALNRAGKKIDHIDMPLTPSRVWSAMNA